MVGGLTGDFDYQFSGKIIVIPDFATVFATVSPFCIGFTPDPATWITAIPYAITAWIIAYGDFITVQELGFAAFREDEHIEFDANRTNVICGIRNVILSLCAPYPALAGPLSPPYCIATYARYHQGGREAMDSIYDGSATNLIFTVLSLFIYPLYEASLAASGTLLVVIMVIQGFVCAQIDCNMLRDDMDKGLAGMGAGLVVARGAAVALPASIILYLLLCNNKKIKEDYRLNKEIQSQEDEETERQLAILEARMRGGKAEDGMPVEPMKKE